HVHDEDVADAAARSQAGLLRDHRAEQLVAVEAALHQDFSLALTHELDRPRGGRMAVRRIDDPRPPQIDPARCGALLDAGLRADGKRHDQSLCACVDRRGQRSLLARMRDGGSRRFEALASRQQLLVLSGSGLSHETLSSAAVRVRAAGPVSRRTRVSTIASPTPYMRGWNAVW